jgi:hypothetical protein
MKLTLQQKVERALKLRNEARDQILYNAIIFFKKGMGKFCESKNGELLELVYNTAPIATFSLLEIKKRQNYYQQLMYDNDLIESIIIYENCYHYDTEKERMRFYYDNENNLKIHDCFKEEDK